MSAPMSHLQGVFEDAMPHINTCCNVSYVVLNKMDHRAYIIRVPIRLISTICINKLKAEAFELALPSLY